MNVRRRSISATAVTALAALGAVALSSCSSSGASADDGGKGGKLDVVASFYPMQFLAEQIGGDHVNVSTLTKPGVEPHDLEITPQQTGKLGEADFVLYLGGLQPAVDEAVKQSGVKTSVDAAEFTTLEKHGDEVGHDHGDEGEEAHDHGDEGDENGTDPHIWLDPVRYSQVAKGVGEKLAKADPDHASDYRANTKKLTGKLASLNKEFKDGLSSTRTKTFITTHSAFGYLAERYGLEQEGISGIDPESEPSPARMKQLQEIAKKDHVTTVFFEALASDKTAKTLARDTGLRTAVLDPMEGITSKSAGDDYLEVMRSNLTTLRKALGAK
ncbi:metal ABC transporter substrate-binding protein [Streptomyces tsukubensis]|uniref:Zinc ABC transporter substrate-binding protein n=1 Tax=Streptomyces tsukubensis TaxID=83656 RepID=A0A1V4AB62_9ACTN|nr:metal ABC transporter substrate-binding protein [Streptomyces tsukubensis]OON80878.1 zinc ABC transporter substrate-binding protein [Streptomyces tsukubensis]QFR93477.1 zinc ABC transporter substrate-binding protein [Streptomyces tsukubensis]